MEEVGIAVAEGGASIEAQPLDGIGSARTGVEGRSQKGMLIARMRDGDLLCE